MKLLKGLLGMVTRSAPRLWQSSLAWSQVLSREDSWMHVLRARYSVKPRGQCTVTGNTQDIIIVIIVVIVVDVLTFVAITELLSPSALAA